MCVNRKFIKINAYHRHYSEKSFNVHMKTGFNVPNIKQKINKINNKTKLAI